MQIFKLSKSCPHAHGLTLPDRPQEYEEYEVFSRHSRNFPQLFLMEWLTETNLKKKNPIKRGKVINQRERARVRISYHRESERE